MNFTGPKLEESDITVQFGAEPRAQHPAETRHLSPTALEGFMAAVRSIYVTEANRAPTLLRDIAPRTINLFRIGKHDKDEGRLVFPGNALKNTRDGKVVLFHGVSLNEPEALGLQFDDQCTMAERMIMTTAHGCRNILTRHAVHSFNKGPVDAINAAFDNHYYPNVLEARVHDVRPERTHATTGLNSPVEWGIIEYSQNARIALDYCAETAIQDATTEELWQIVSNLTEKAHSENRFPVQQEVQAEMRNVLQERADLVFTSPAFKPITQGKHTIVFECGGPDGKKRVTWLSFTAVKNSDGGFRLADQKVIVDPTAFRTYDNFKNNVDYEFFDAKGGQLNEFACQNSSGRSTTTFEGQAKSFCEAGGPPAVAFMKKVSRIRLNMGNIGVFDLPRVQQK